MKNCTDYLYIFMTNWADFTSVTSADTADLTSTVSTSFSSQESVDCTSSLFMKQFIMTMRENWFFKQQLSDSSMFEGREWSSGLD